jgi:hypothetical protein
MSTTQGSQSDISSARESGTTRDSMSGNNPAKGGPAVRRAENRAWRLDEPLDDISSAPESGTVRDETSGNNPAKGDDFEQETEPARGAKECRPGRPPNDVSSAPESGTVR